MSSPETEQAHTAQAVIARFVAACQADARVVAAFLGGSYARGAADAYSDLDLYLILADAAYDDFLAERRAFIRLLGDPVFMEDWDEYGFDLLLFILDEGVEGELGLGRVSGFTQIHSGPYQVLVDKQGILAGAAFPGNGPAPAEQVERLRSLVNWFWHDLSHFTTALGRGQLWAAQGHLEDLRRTCVILARLRHDFAAEAAGYEKVDQALPVVQLAPLAATFGPLNATALLQAAHIVVRFYQDLVPDLARAHGIAYPHGAEAVISARLERLSQIHS